MCLDLKKSEINVLVATKNIKCYKYLDELGYQLTTPYRDSVVEIGKTYNSSLRKVLYCSVDDLSNYETDTIVGYIDFGLHSLSSLKPVVKNCVRDISRCVVECIIPKGSEYYVGSYDGEVSYASNKLKYVKKYSKFTTFFLLRIFYFI